MEAQIKEKSPRRATNAAFLHKKPFNVHYFKWNWAKSINELQFSWYYCSFQYFNFDTRENWVVKVNWPSISYVYYMIILK